MKNNFYVTSLALVISFSNCSKPTEQKEVSKPSVPQSSPVVEAKRGSISLEGVVSYFGSVPKEVRNPALSSADCGAQPNDQNQNDIRVKDGKLMNVFVYIQDDLSAGNYPVPTTPAVLDQQSCAYTPRVLGVQVNQPVEIINSDATLHNVHSLNKVNPFNLGMPVKGMKITKTFSQPEIMSQLKCDVHPWMHAFVGVMTHPFFAVSKEDGTFLIQNLPEGDFSISAWHEKLGKLSQRISVKATSVPKVSFDFIEKK